MSFRNRPVLDRRHRPRWQDELRTQQLLLAGFAIAIALAVGIFGAAAWNGYWDAHLRPVADVDGRTFDRSALAARERIIGSELVARITDLQSLLGGGRDQLVQQEIDALSAELQGVTSLAGDSLVEGAILASRAGEIGVTVGEDETDAEVEDRRTLPERSDVQLILIDSLPADAALDAEPTDEQVAAARAEAEAALERITGGEDFAAVASEVSDDFSASTGGALGWLEPDGATLPEYAAAAAEIDVGDVAGPLEVERGWALIRVADRREAGPDETLAELLERNGVSDEAYRAYVRDELLTEAYRTHFTEEVAVSPQPQRRVAQIFIAPAQGEGVEERRARHILVQPLPDAQDQSTASEEQWQAALAEAEQVADKVAEPDADWFAIADEHSDDTNSVPLGGDLGWFPAAGAGFVPEFSTALEALSVGETSEPVRTTFGYHVVQVTGERASPQEQASALIEQLRDDPDSFAATARMVSQDYPTAREGGELGWVAPYELDEQHELVIFALDEASDIADPLDLGGEGIMIYQLLDSSDGRPVEEARLAQIRSAGFDRWLEREVRAGVPVWVDPQFASATA